MFVGGGGGGGRERVGFEVGFDVFGDDELTPHNARVTGEGADVFVGALGPDGGQLEGLALSGLEQLGGGDDGAVFGDPGAALAVGVAGGQLHRGEADFFAAAGGDDDEVVRHDVGVFENDFERATDRDNETGDIVAHLFVDGADDEDGDAEGGELRAECFGFGGRE